MGQVFASYVSPAGVTRPHHCPEVLLGDVALRVLLAEVVELRPQQLPVLVGRVGHDEVEVGVGEARLGHSRPLAPGLKLVTLRVFAAAVFVHAATQQCPFR